MGFKIGLMWRAGLVIAAVAATALLAPRAFTQAPQDAKFKIDPPSQNVQLTQSEVSFTMKLEDAVNLAAWEFRFAFDPDVLTYKGVTPSGFLAQSGRTQQCPSPIVVTDVDIPDVGTGLTTVQYGCNTPGSSLPGVNGDGDLAVVRFAPKAAGTANLVCNKLEVTDAFADVPNIVTNPCTGVIKVLSGDGGGNGGNGSDNGGNDNGGNNSNQLEPTPTPNVRVLTPTAIPNAVVTQTLRINDGSGVDPTAPGAPRSDSASGGTTGSPSSSGSGSTGSESSGGRSGVLGGIQGVANAPVAGYGMARDAFFTLSLWAQLTLLAGVLVVGTGAVVRVRSKR